MQVKYLVHQGWGPSHFVGVYLPGGQKDFVATWLARPLNYLRALALAPGLFAKGLSGISHFGPDIYYKHIIQDGDITNIKKIDPGRINDMTMANVIAVIRGVMPAVGDGEVPPVGDGGGASDIDLEPGPDGELDVLFDPILVGPPLPPAPAPAVPPAPVAVPVVVEREPIDFNIGGYPAMRVTFDKWSHGTGNQRAYLYCKGCDHDKDGGRCRLYVSDTPVSN